MNRDESFLFLEKIGNLKVENNPEDAAPPFSVDMACFDARNMWDPYQAMKHVPSLGVKRVRLHSGWSRIEKEEGEYDFTWLDPLVDELCRNGIRPWMTLCYGNPVYSPECTNETGQGWSPVYTERGRLGWTNFVQTVVSHFKGKIDSFEVWNEPDGTGFWRNPGGPDPKGYSELVKITAAAIRRANPEAEVIGGAIANCTRRDFMQGMVDHGALEHLDCFSVHHYSQSPELYDNQFYDSLRNLLEAGKKGIRIWMGEGGGQSSTLGYGAAWDKPWTEDLQARFLLKRLVSDFAGGVELSNYFHLSDLKVYKEKGIPESRKSCYFGLLRKNDYSPKPSWFSMQAICSLLGGAELSPSSGMFIYEEERDGRGMFVRRAVFQKRGAPVFAYWNPASVFAGIGYDRCHLFYFLDRSLELKEPVLVDPLTREVFFVFPARDPAIAYREPMSEEFRLRHLPIADYPLFITERKNIQLEQYK